MMKQLRYAFTLLELVIVLIVIGVLVAIGLPRINRELKIEAENNLLAAIRYTQHLALNDNKHQYNKSNWHQRLWMIRFEKYNGNWIFKIGADNDMDGNIDKKDAAVDPQSGKYFFSTDDVIDDDEAPQIFLTRKYNITDISFNGCKGTQSTDARHLAFDHYGRVFRGILKTSSTNGASNDFRTYVKNGQCEITFTSPSFEKPLKIIILEETGYAYIDGQENS